MSVDIAPYRRSDRLDGQCLCGAVQITVDGDHVAAVGACHCGMCRRWSGTVYASFDATPSAVIVTGEVTRYASTSFSERAFCPTCGSHLWLRNLGEVENYELMPGLFDGASDMPLISEIYKDRAPRYLPISGDHAIATQAQYEAKAQHVPDASAKTIFKED